MLGTAEIRELWDELERAKAEEKARKKDRQETEETGALQPPASSS